jgi:hypothetical protein
MLKPLERLTGAELIVRVEPPEDVVEAAVLEHHDHDMVEPRLTALGQWREPVPGVVLRAVV